MNATQRIERTISDRLTWAEICERYPDQHVYLVDAERTAPSHPEVISARVIGCGPTHRAALDQAMPWRELYEEFAHRFTGRATAPLIRPTVVIDDEIREFIRYRR